MPIFIVISTTHPRTKVGTEIANKDLPHFKVDDGVWLVSASRTTQQVAEDLGIRGGENGSGLVCSVSNWSGRLPKDAWEWFRLYETPT